MMEEIIITCPRKEERKKERKKERENERASERASSVEVSCLLHFSLLALDDERITCQDELRWKFHAYI
jgi:hypothetical protein